MVRDGDRFLWCQAEGNVGVSIWVSDRLTSMGTKHVVWMAEAEGACSKEVWAPELHLIDGRWHIYFAASNGENRNHRTFVLVADTDDPLGSYSLHGPVFTGDEPGGDNLWSIDFTVLQHHGRLYGLWSGWPDLDTDLQHLYAAEMSSPTEIKTGRVRLLEAGTFDWQRVDETLPDARPDRGTAGLPARRRTRSSSPTRARRRGCRRTRSVSSVSPVTTRSTPPRGRPTTDPSSRAARRRSRSATARSSRSTVSGGTSSTRRSTRPTDGSARSTSSRSMSQPAGLR